MRCSWTTCAILLSLSLAGMGCGPEDENNSNLPFDTGTDSGMDAGDTVEDAGDDADAADTADAQGDVIIGQSCEARPEDLGTLTVGDSLDFDRPFRTRPENTRASCQEPPSRAGIYVFEFQVEETSKVEMALYPAAGTTPAMELRVGECLELGASQFCGTQIGRTAVVEPGISYYLFIQGNADSEASSFRMTFDVTEAACGPSDEICESGAQQFCPTGDQLETRSCAESCASEEACTGDTCAEAISVDLSSSNSYTFEGDRYAYSNEWNAQGRTGCALDAEGDGSDSPQQDLFFAVSGHAEGDTLTFNAEDGQSQFGFYLLDACDAAGCVDAGAYADDVGPNEFIWTATTSETVYVAADVIGPPRDRGFNISITKE